MTRIIRDMKFRKLGCALGLAGSALFLSCATRLPIPTPGDRDRVSLEWPAVQLGDLRQGRKLYLENCAGCHSLHLPSEFTRTAWEKVLDRMQPKTRLRDEEMTAILKYLAAFSRGSSGQKAQAP